MNSPNVVCLILDCLRADAITRSDAPNIRTLADRNLSFEACVTPANWSLPSHASLFTGEWPHEHGYFTREHYFDDLPLTETLRHKGYETIGASANVFASSTYGLDRGFDRFFETRRPINPRGLNPFANVRRIRDGEEATPSDYVQTFVDSLRHERPIASVDNFARSVVLSLDRRFGLRQYIPFLVDDNYGFLTRAAGRTTEFLVEEIQRTADREAPLFAFANYMVTHYPYQPPARHFQAVTDGEYDISDLRSIDPDISHSQEFRNAVCAGTLDEDDLNLVRAAYRAEVRSVDEQVGRIVEALEAAGLREETVIVITADHGECLGETDLRGEQVMGHHDGVSEHLWRVPLIVANPHIDEETVDRRTSLKSLFDLFTGDMGSFLDDGGRGWPKYFGGDPVFFELPAHPFHKSSLQSYDHIPDWFIERVAETHTVVGFDGEWTVIIDSTGEVNGFRDGEVTDMSLIPSDLRTACADAVTAFQSAAGQTENDLSKEVEQQLEDLGYV